MICVSALLKFPLTYICSDIVNGEHLAFEMLVNNLSIISVCTAESLSRWVQAHRRAVVIVLDPDTLLSFPIILPAVRLLSLNTGLGWTPANAA